VISKKQIEILNNIEYKNAKYVLSDIAKFNKFCIKESKKKNNDILRTIRDSLIILFKNDLIYNTVKKYITSDQEVFMTFLFSDHFQKISDLKKLKKIRK